MSVATVYRNLPVFCEAGILRRTCLSSGENLYEVVRGRRDHDHLICSGCGRVVEFVYDAFDVLQRAVAEKHGFLPRSHHLEIIGLCPGCRARGGTGSQEAD
jgi:Fur family ferric uptake transcriptional regulator